MKVEGGGASWTHLHVADGTPLHHFVGADAGGILTGEVPS